MFKEQFKNPIEKYHTVGTVQNPYRKIPHCRNSSKTLLKITTLSEQFKNPIGKYHTVGTVQNPIEKYHTVGTVQNPIEKYHTVETVQKPYRKIPHCRNSSKTL